MRRPDPFGTREVIRLAKALLTLSVSAAGAAVVLHNLVDYRLSLKYVRHVMSMDTIFPESRNRFRAVTSPAAHHASLILIILTEALMAALCGLGGVRLLRALRADAQTFHAAKRPGLLGLLVGLLLWFFGFQVVAGSWFEMWMSKQYNGLPDANRLTLFIAAVLVFVAQRNDD
jgi:predicted small integral membrane protein